MLSGPMEGQPRLTTNVVNMRLSLRLSRSDLYSASARGLSGPRRETASRAGRATGAAQTGVVHGGWPWWQA